MKTNLNVDTQALREKILDLAMRGKLVEQDAGDEPASVLLEKIKAEKAELVKEGKIKKSKKLPEITDDEKPFDIPDSWEWVRLGTCVTIERGGSPRPIKKYLTDSKEGVNWIKIGDTQKNNKYITSTKEKIIKEGLAKSREVHSGDFLLSNSMSFGKPYILKIDGAIHDGWLVLSMIGNTLEVNFLYYLLCSPCIQYFFKYAATGTTVKNLNKDRVSITPIPLPPLAEQRRIAAKVSELFSQIDVIEKNVAEYQDLEQAMRSKLMDLAMRGKLVEQDPNDESASELLKQIQSEKAQLVKEGKIKRGKKLPKITDDEKPFDIPDGWEWVRLGDIINIISGRDLPKTMHLKERNRNAIPYITGASNIENGKIITNVWTDKPVTIARKGDILLTVKGTVGKIAVLDIDMAHIARQIMALSPISNMIDQNYIILFLKWYVSVLQQKATGMIPGVTREDVSTSLIPLPPLAEQRRIANKVSKLFEQLDIINNNLVSAS